MKFEDHRIGFDLIDLSDPLLKNRSERALKLIQHPNDLFDPSIENSFWYLWTAKEASYKCLPIYDHFKPITLAISANQKSFECLLGCFGNYYFINGCLIATCITIRNLKIGYYIEKITKPSERSTYEPIIKNYFRKNYTFEIDVCRDQYQIPYLKEKKRGIIIDFSLSHHHQYFGFAYHILTN
jgi:phosphopantetheinyl transferase